MAAINQRIRNKVRGDDIPVVRSYVDLPENDNVSTARLTVKVNEADADPGIFQIAVTSVAGAGGIINDVNVPEVKITFIISKTQSLLLTAGTSYYYDIQIDTVGGYTYTCEKGTIVLLEQVTQAVG